MKRVKSVVTLFVAVLAIAGLCYSAMNGIGKSHYGAVSEIKLGLDLAGGVSITYEVAGETEPSQTDMDDTIYKLQQRVDQYSTEAIVYQEGTSRINIEIPGMTDAEIILEELGRPGSLYFIVLRDGKGNLNYEFDYTQEKYVLKKSLEEVIADGSAILSGSDVTGAQSRQQVNQYNQPEHVVELTFSDAGADIFAEATREAYLNGRETIGIYYDGEFISVPQVNSEITGGVAYISGMSTKEQADKLASNIRIGGLKLELEELHSKVVGAQLGEEAIETSVLAGAIGLALVILFMIAVYRIPGLASGIALVIYVLLMMFIICAFEITLTLPGIAGIILSIGMAVDANVIIFARIKEEIASGKTVRSSIKIGFQKALSAIVDGNVTTLIAAVVLGLLGTGTVKGFAITLGVGIILSMFTALVITRLVLLALFGVGFKGEKLYGAARERKNIHFLGKKNICFSVSLALIAVGFIAMTVFGVRGKGVLNFGLDFSGGTSTTVVMNETMTLDEVNNRVVPVVEDVIGAGNIQTQTVNDSAEVIIKTRTLDSDERTALKDALTERFNIQEEIQQETISATISSEMRNDAIIAVVVATICMLIYIWFRFSDIRFATSAVLALVHDVLIVLGFYAVFRISVNSNFIACMLTIVGYSINATIVIFDRIRENMAEMKKRDTLVDVVNRSITQTLTRSVYSSLTTAIMVIMLLILSVSSIKLFALPLLIGIVCGTYSSVCLAGAVWYVLRMKFPPKKEEA